MSQNETGKGNSKLQSSENNPEVTSGAKISYWVDSVEPIKFEQLKENLTTETVIVGGGISGLTTAYLLTKKGHKVVLLEDGNIGSGETGRTTAHISNALDDRYYDIEKMFGEEGSKLAAESHTAAIEFIEKISTDENIDCDFVKVNGFLFLHPSDSKDSIQNEYDATRRAELETEIVNSIPGIQNTEPPYLRFASQAQFHPMKYLAGLCKAIIQDGGKIYTSSHVKEFDKTKVTLTNGYTVNANHIVVATNSPINDKVKMHTKQAPYRSYVIGAKVKKNQLPYALWWDSGDYNSEWPTYPYHYARLQKFDNEFDLLIVGGEDHKTGQQMEENIPEDQRFENLINWTKEKFPMVEDVIYKWSGQVMEPADALGYAGRNPGDENIYIATGDSGNGITHGTISGIIISSLIMNLENRWYEIYAPSRKPKSSTSLKDFLVEQGNVAKKFVEYLTPGDIDSVKDLTNGQGAIIRDGLTKAAVYRDDEGKLHAYTAICPHMKCILEWNETEKSFDCPCHGSRFNSYGKVINGPAQTDLEQVGIPEE